MKDDRRAFLKLSALTAVSTALAACGTAPTATPSPVPPTATKPPAPTVATAPAAPTATTAAAAATKAPSAAATAAPTMAPAAKVAYKEAPQLAAMVKAGKLPPVAQRLPENPVVVKPWEKIGKYGGTWRRAYKGVSDAWGPTKLLEEPLIQWDWTEKAELRTVPNLCEKWEQNAAASEYTFYLRKGIKWSDGEEFNTDDVKFWYEDILMNKDITPEPATYYKDANNKPLSLEIIDKYTFKVIFGTTKALLTLLIPKHTLGLQGGPTFAAPEHYMKKFHPKYAKPEDIDKEVKDRKVQNWQQLWNSGAGDLAGVVLHWFRNAERPTISAWQTKVSPLTEPTHISMERNPYYFKVDTEGNQLPYIDGITHDLYDNAEVFNMWLISGKIDCQWRGVDAGNYTLYKENEKKGDYRIVKWRSATTSGFMPNLNCPDEVLAKLFDMAKFRQALSIAINRKEINELIYNGLYMPRQASPVKGSPQYDAEFEKKWAEYDPATASKLLDELGLKMGADGKTRTRPDGKPLEVTIKTADVAGSLRLDECQRVAGYWSAVGVRTTVKQTERSLYEEQSRNGDIEVGRWDVDRSAVVMADAGRYLLTMTDGPVAPLYGNWYTKSVYKKVEPPADHPIKKIWALWDKCQVEPDEAKRNDLLKQIIDINKEAPFQIGTVGEYPALFITKNNFHNLPADLIQDDTLRDYGLAKTCQFYMDT